MCSLADYLDPAVWSLFITLATLVGTWAFRKRIGRAVGKLLFRSALDAICTQYFDSVEVKDSEGKKRVLMRPNDAAGALLAKYGPLSAAYAMEWAKRNIKIKLPPLELPEGSDLKTLGMSALGQKVLSGKKLQWEDAIPLALGYAKEWAEKSGILEKLTKIVPGAKKAAAAPATALTPEAQAIVDKALNP